MNFARNVGDLFRFNISDNLEKLPMDNELATYTQADRPPYEKLQGAAQHDMPFVRPCLDKVRRIFRADAGLEFFLAFHVLMWMVEFSPAAVGSQPC